MITSTDFFTEKLRQIEWLLFNEESRPAITIMTRIVHEPDTPEKITDLYKRSFVAFPLNTDSASNQIRVRLDAVKSYYRFYALESRQPTDAEIDQDIALYDEENAREGVEDFLSEKIRNLFYEFNAALEYAATDPCFAGIQENKLIVKNLINYYLSIKNSTEVQLSLIWGITVTKEIADIATGIYVDFLTDRLAMMEIETVLTEKSVPAIKAKQYKIKWNGEQQAVAELLIELHNKKWINLDQLGYNKTANLALQIFDVSETIRKEGAKTEANISQLLKGVFNRELNRKEYFFEGKPSHPRNFSEIKNCE